MSGVRHARVLVGTVTGLIVLLLIGRIWLSFTQAADKGVLGFDYGVHVDIARRWLDTGALYAPTQLNGPYTNDPTYTPAGVLNFFPPPVVLLFAPFVLLPAFLFWAIPIGITAAMVVYWRPAWWSWPLFLGALWVLPLGPILAVGNSVMWGVAATSLATRWPGVAVFLGGKPVLAPYALLFIRRSRSWLVCLAIAAVAALLFLPDWGDYLTSVRNAATGFGIIGTLLYSMPSPLLVLTPLIPWLARTRRAPRADQAPTMYLTTRSASSIE